VWSKACTIRDGADPARVLRGPKITAFWSAILGDQDAVVLDSWMLRAMRAKARVTVPQYHYLARILAREARANGVAPSKFQAVVWCVIRSKGVTS
jgi:hypothetical protein